MADAVYTAPGVLTPSDRKPAAALRTFGRFALRQLLGRSSLTMAWLAHDPRVRQDVLLMLPRKPPATAGALRLWAESVQRAGRLSHPRLLAPVEVSAHEGWPYLVCERSAGAVTMAEYLSGHRPPAPAEVVDWCVDLLSGLAVTHEANLCHGDIGLHSVVIDRQGHLALWGLAVSCEAAPDEMPGSTGALERLRAHAERDVAASGLLLFQWLSRQSAFDEPDLSVASARLGEDVVRLPFNLPHPVPEALRAIVNRAVDRHPRRRYVGARSFERALDGWRQVQSADRDGPLALLLDRLRTAGHLPAQPGLAQRVVQVARMENRRVDVLADLVLQDPALSFELLRMVNLAQFGAGKEGQVVTVRRAILLMGVAGVRRAASSLRSWPGPLRGDAVEAMQAGMRRAWLAGHLAEVLAPGGLDAESALLAAQLQHLGRMLVLYHFPAEAAQIHALMQFTPARSDTEPAIPGLSESAAAMAVLGVDLPALALSMARHWGLGEVVLEMMVPLPLGQMVHTPVGQAGWFRLVASCANEILEADELAAPLQPRAFGLVVSRYAKSLGLTSDEIRASLIQARVLLSQHGLEPARSPLGSADASPDGPT